MNYTEHLNEIGIASIVKGAWAHVGETQGITAGWKLHLSSIQKEALKLLDSVAPTLVAEKIAFKIAKNSEVLGRLNEGSMGSTQVGKFATIYPKTPEESLLLSEKLIPTLDGFDGPRIVTDIHLKHNLYARFGPYSPLVQRDRLGNIDFKYQRVGDQIVDTSYSVPFVPPENTINPFIKYIDKESKKEERLWGPGFLIVGSISKNAKGNCYWAIDLRAREKITDIIIKEGRSQCMSDENGRSMEDRIRYQYEVQKELCKTAPVPEPLALFEYNKNMYLAMEYIKGTSLLSLVGDPFILLKNKEKCKLLDVFMSFATAVQAFHNAGYIHRDLSPRNVVVTQNGVFLIDMELSTKNGKQMKPFGMGTPGFYSPQQEAGDIPTTADDVFSLGACFYYLLTSINPEVALWARSKKKYQSMLEEYSVPNPLAEMIAKCMSENPEERPILNQIVGVLSTEIKLSDCICNNTYLPTKSIEGTKSCSYRDVAAGALKHLCSQAFVEEKTGLWLSSEIKRKDFEGPSRKMAEFYALQRSANRGVSGVVYAISRMKTMGYEYNGNKEIVGNAVDWLLEHAPTRDDQLPGLHFGEAGVAVAICEAVKADLIERGPWILEYLNETFSDPPDWPDLTHGAAGQGLACLKCSEIVTKSSLVEKSHAYADYLIRSQNKDGSWEWPEGVDGMKGTKYTGFAHGVAGIIYFMEVYGNRFSDKAALDSSGRGSEWLIRNAISRDNGTVEWAIQDGSEDIWKWWCHGAPGIALAFIKIYEKRKDIKYREIARKALLVNPQEIASSNLSLCHGIGGLAYIYLVAASTFNESMWRKRAKSIIDRLVALGRNSEGGISWLVEDPFISTADLMVGNAGLALLIAEYASQSEVREFPLL
ncbi:MAG: lanthionine synthetase LanC family protein [Bacilli bacterium]